MDWLYAQKKLKPSTFAKAEGLAFGIPVQQADILCPLWLLGEYIRSDQYKIQVMEELLQDKTTRDRAVCAVTVDRVIRHTRPGSGLRNWLMDHLAAFLSEKQLDGVLQILPDEMIRPLLRKCVAIRGGRRANFDNDKCFYHDHVGTEKCK